MLHSPAEKARDGIDVCRGWEWVQGCPSDYVSYCHFLFFLVENKECGFKKEKRFQRYFLSSQTGNPALCPYYGVGDQEKTQPLLCSLWVVISVHGVIHPGIIADGDFLQEVNKGAHFGPPP